MNGILANIIPSVAGIVLVIAYLPQLVQTLKTKDVSALNTKFCILLSIAVGLLFVNSIYVFVNYGDWGYMLTEAANFGLAVTMLILVLKFRRNPDLKNNVK